MGNQKGVIMARKRYSAEQIIGHLRQAEILIPKAKRSSRLPAISVSANRLIIAGVRNTAAWKSPRSIVLKSWNRRTVA